MPIKFSFLKYSAVPVPLSASIEPRIQTVEYGSLATLTCNKQGNPIKSIEWMRNGVKLNHSDTVLRIEQVRSEDKGMYQCFVLNDQESAQASAELKLGGRCNLTKSITAYFQIR